MNPFVKNLLAVILGWAIGSTVNMGLINLGHYFFPLDGVESDDIEAMSQVFVNLDIEYYIFPFLAHAIGTLVGAMVAGFIAARIMRSAMIIGILFLLGGITMCFLIQGPIWFMSIDILLAYIPMAYLGGTFVQKFKNQMA